MIKAKSLAAALLASASAVVLAAAPALGATAIQYTEIPLSQSEIDNNWVTDRTTPSGGYESIEFDGRTSVLEMRLDTELASTKGAFYQSEGLKRAVDGVNALKVDLYIDPEWVTADVPVRAGLWGVGHDPAGSVAAYPIIEFTTMGEGEFVGWRTWDGVNGGWTNHDNAMYVPGQWATLEIFHSADSAEFGMTVNGQAITTNVSGDSVSFGSVILNQFNSALPGKDYATHWSKFATGTLVNVAGSKQDCFDGGYADYGFKNQGQCIASLVAADGAAG